MIAVVILLLFRLLFIYPSSPSRGSSKLLLLFREYIFYFFFIFYFFIFWGGVGFNIWKLTVFLSIMFNLHYYYLSKQNKRQLFVPTFSLKAPRNLFYFSAWPWPFGRTSISGIQEKLTVEYIENCTSRGAYGEQSR